MAKTWREKWADLTSHQLKIMPVTRAGVVQGGRMLLPSIRQIDDFIRKLPKGKFVTNADMRRILARRCKADGCCPVYTGYHLRTCAEVAIEDYEAGAPITSITPVWRVLDDKAPTLKKLSSKGRRFIEMQRKKENL